MEQHGCQRILFILLTGDFHSMRKNHRPWEYFINRGEKWLPNGGNIYLDIVWNSIKAKEYYIFCSLIIILAWENFIDRGKKWLTVGIFLDIVWNSMAAKEYDHLFKLLIIGDSGVGKSSLLVRSVTLHYFGYQHTNYFGYQYTY